MAIVSARRYRPPLVLGPDQNGTVLLPAEFDEAEFEEGWRYELIHGVLVVSAKPLEEERDSNGELEYLLRLYRDTHPKGSVLNKTLSEQIIRTKSNRRAADRVIWAGLGRVPRRNETPTVAVEFVSAGRRNRERDYEQKRKEYAEIRVQEYWIIDRFDRTMTVYLFGGARPRKRVIRENETYTTKLLPGFKLPLARLFAQADDWEA